MKDLKQRIEEIKRKLNFDQIFQEIQEIQRLSANPEFWQDHEEASKKMKRLADLQKEIEEIEKLENLVSLGKEQEAEKEIQKLELKTFLGGKYDSSGAIFSIHAGQGGTEAMDWAEMLKRMYLRYFEKRNWDYEIIDETPGEEAGIKSVTFKIDAPYAYGYLKHEAGTHRLVRQSPFNADRLRQTSFALVEVLPQLEEKEIEIKEEDLEWEFFRASSQGGQNVQKVSTAVRLRHKPTGIVVTSQSERYQAQNRKIALQILQAKLWQKEEEKRAEEERQLKQGKTKASWGTQIRSYVLHPYKMVKDLRTGYESNDPEAILNGEIDGFIEAEIRQLS
ncbi:MAG: peptide chain release factor 2 [Microgenomates group bacterium]